MLFLLCYSDSLPQPHLESLRKNEQMLISLYVYVCVCVAKKRYQPKHSYTHTLTPLYIDNRGSLEILIVSSSIFLPWPYMGSRFNL